MGPLTEREKMVSGRLYLASDRELMAARYHARRVMAAYGRLDPGATDERHSLLADLFARVGEGVTIEAPLHCDYGWNITLGANVYINAFCSILDCAAVIIGDNALIGPGVQICAVTHPVDPEERVRGLEYARPITIGRNVWIGAAAMIGPGVTIGADSTVGAGSVVLKDVPPRVVVAGNPARRIRSV